MILRRHKKQETPQLERERIDEQKPEASAEPAAPKASVQRKSSAK